MLSKKLNYKPVHFSLTINNNGTINNDLQKIANRTSLFGFNKMSDYIKKICKKAEFEKKESSKGER